MSDRDWLEIERAVPERSPASEHRIVGPPGTGKTYTLTQYAARGAEKHGADAVAIASLTKAAAQEIASRAEGIPKQNVGTLHAHAFRGLDRPSLAETPEGLKEWNLHVENRAPALRVRAGAGIDEHLDFAPDTLASAATDGEKLLAELSTERARMSDPEAWRGPLRRFAELWDEWKAKTGRLDFTDLIEKALVDLPRMPGDPMVVLLDEAQDLSALEFSLGRTWGSQAEEFVVCGDPDQNLYSWRGADPDAFWAGEAASERVIDRSRRVPKAVADYALEWVKRIPGRRHVEYQPRLSNPDDPSSAIVEGEVRSLHDPRQRATYGHPDPLLAEIGADLDRGETVMVLASCAYMLEPLARLLKERGIPYHNPYRPKHGGWNPLRGAGRPLAFLRPSKAAWGDEARLWTWEDLHAWTEPLAARGTLSHGAKAFIEAKQKSAMFADGELRDQEVPFDLLFEGDRALLVEAARDPAFSMDLQWWEDSLLARHQATYAYPCRVARAQGPAALREKPRLILGTIHSVKGGEADSVYVFPDLSRAAHLAPGHHPHRPDPAIVRLFYVAFTRARLRLTLLEAHGPEYVALPRPGGGTVGTRPRGGRLGALAKATLEQGGARRAPPARPPTAARRGAGPGSSGR